MNKPYKNSNSEQGAAMVIALVMLLVLTLLATASARMTLMEERMTGNTQDRTIAFQAAEAGLRAGEAQARVQDAMNFYANAAGLYESATPGNTPVWKGIDWADSSAVMSFAGLASAPGMLSESSSSYVVEQMPYVPTGSLCGNCPVDEALFYRVTSRGVGVGGNAVVTLQTTFKR